MADSKISALPASTTPLAGTEVLPIVQSSTTKQVSVANLTAGRDIAATSLTTAAVQATNSGGLTLKNSSGTTQLSVGAGGGDNVTLSVATNITPANAAVAISPTGTGTVAISPAGALTINPTAASTINNVSIGATTALTGRFTSATLTTGDLSISTSGKGIAFSSGGTITSLRGQTSVGGSSTVALTTLANASENRVYQISVRQAGANSNTVIAQVLSYGANCLALRIAQDNVNPALDMNITTSGLDVQLTLAAGFGTTTWDWVLTRFA